MTTSYATCIHAALSLASTASTAARDAAAWLGSLVPPHVVNPLGWALLHFLWQGLLIGLLAAGTLAVLRRRSASGRYLTGCVALLALAVAPAVTFVWLYQPPRAIATAPSRAVFELPAAEGAASALPEALDPRLALGGNPVVASSAVPWHRAARDWCEARLSWFVGLWLAGVLILSAWLLAGWVQVQRWRQRLVTPFAQHWQQIVAELAQRLRLRQAVRVVESHLADVPMALGWLRPVILVPACAVTGLTPEQLRALLAHELAHVKRYDYLVNLAQSAIETVFFYHPAVWWISRCVRVEREHCCDDLAVQACESPAAYVGALASAAELARARMAELRRRAAVPAARLEVAATGGALLRRARRMLGASEPHRTPSAQWVAGALVLGALAAFGAGLHVSAAQPAAMPEREELARTVAGQQQRYSRMQIVLRAKTGQSGTERAPESTQNVLLTYAQDAERDVIYGRSEEVTASGARLQSEVAWDGHVKTELRPAGRDDPSLVGYVAGARPQDLNKLSAVLLAGSFDGQELDAAIRAARDFDVRPVERDGRSLRQVELTTLRRTGDVTQDGAPPLLRIVHSRLLLDPQRNWLCVAAEVNWGQTTDFNAPAPALDADGATQYICDDFREVTPGLWAPYHMHAVARGASGPWGDCEVQSIVIGPAADVPERVQFPPGIKVIDESKATSQPATDGPPKAEVWRGVVRDEQGNPVGGARVSILDEDSVTVGADGRFVVPASQLPEPAGRIVYARHAERKLAAIVQLGADDQEVVLTLSPTAALTGRVIDTEGRPIANASVRLSVSEWSTSERVDKPPTAQSDGGPIGMRTMEARTDEDGRYRVADLPAWGYWVSAHASGYGEDSVIDVRVTAGASEVRVRDLVLLPATLHISGVVVNEAGKPAAGVRVYCSGSPQSFQEVKTDAEGHFRLDRMCAGLASVNAYDNRRKLLGQLDVQIKCDVEDARIVLGQPPSTMKSNCAGPLEDPMKPATEAATQPAASASGPPPGTLAPGSPERTQILAKLAALRAKTIQTAASGSGTAEYVEKGHDEYRSAVEFAYSGARVLTRHSDAQGLERAYLADAEREVFYFAGRNTSGAQRSVSVHKLEETSSFRMPTRAAFSFTSFATIPVPVPEDRFFAAVRSLPERATVEVRDGRWVTISTDTSPDGRDRDKLVFDLQLGGMLVSYTNPLTQPIDGHRRQFTCRWEWTWRAEGEAIVPISRKIVLTDARDGEQTQRIEQSVEIKKFVLREVAPKELSYGALGVPHGTRGFDEINKREFVSSDQTDFETPRDASHGKSAPSTGGGGAAGPG